MESIDAQSIQSLPVCADLGIASDDLDAIFACTDEILEMAKVYT